MTLPCAYVARAPNPQLLQRIERFLGPGPNRPNYLLNLYRGSLPGATAEVLAQHAALPAEARPPEGGAQDMELYFGAEAYMVGGACG